MADKPTIQYGIKKENGDVLWLPVGKKLAYTELAKASGINVVTRAVK